MCILYWTCANGGCGKRLKCCLPPCLQRWEHLGRLGYTYSSLAQCKNVDVYLLPPPPYGVRSKVGLHSRNIAYHHNDCGGNSPKGI